jgi:hypothetical protein
VSVSCNTVIAVTTYQPRFTARAFHTVTMPKFHEDYSEEEEPEPSKKSKERSSKDRKSSPAVTPAWKLRELSRQQGSPPVSTIKDDQKEEPESPTAFRGLSPTRNKKTKQETPTVDRRQHLAKRDSLRYPVISQVPPHYGEDQSESEQSIGMEMTSKEEKKKSKKEKKARETRSRSGAEDDYHSDGEESKNGERTKTTRPSQRGRDMKENKEDNLFKRLTRSMSPGPWKSRVESRRAKSPRGGRPKTDRARGGRRNPQNASSEIEFLENYDFDEDAELTPAQQRALEYLVDEYEDHTKRTSYI